MMGLTSQCPSGPSQAGTGACLCVAGTNTFLYGIAVSTMWVLGGVPIGVAFGLFFLDVVRTSATHWTMFSLPFARRHRIAGLVHLCWLVVGFVDIYVPLMPRLVYDVLLGVSGTVLTLTAASDFREHHSRVENRASGTLEKEATVTSSEMIEHSFYQGLNLVQIVYLHFLSSVPGASAGRYALLACATAPWLARGLFPVNRFSDNYKDADKWTTLIAVMYRMKKYQYVFYKHALLHGLNVTAAVAPASAVGLIDRSYFKLYWMGLNTAYVMEFFLQTLVKKERLSQVHMLALQALLMFACTAATLPVLMMHVSWPLAGLSLFMNVAHRGHEAYNTAIVAAAGAVLGV